MARSTGTASTERNAAPAPDEDVAALCAGRPLRADAQRNRAALLTAALEAFQERGSAASLEDIARRAGVGVGTLYRHFPTRQDLIEAVYVDEVESLCRSAGDGEGGTSWDALVQWFDRFVHYVATKRALVDEMVATIGMDSPVFRTCHEAIFAAGEPLLARAQADGHVRPDVTFHDAIRIVSGVSMIRNSTPEEVRRVLAFALDGLRYRG